VHNFLKSDKSTKISLDLNGAQLLDSASQTVTIKQNGEHRVDWRVQANQIGKLTLLAKALTDTESDAVEMSMEIVPHGLKQTVGNATTLTQNDAEQTSRSICQRIPTRRRAACALSVAFDRGHFIRRA